MNERRAERMRLRSGEAGEVEHCRQWVEVEVRYSDLDAQGRVNNAVFFTYFEQARVAFVAEMRVRGLEQMKEGERSEGSTTLDEPEWQHGQAGGQLAAAGAVEAGRGPQIEVVDIPYVIASASCAYVKPITSLAPIAIGVYCSEMSRVSFEVRYVVCDGGRQTIYATGTTLIVNVDAGTGRPRMLPEWMRRVLLV